ncbi:MAG: hypothetical protein ABI555_07895 [Chloroflexota bacterium]
MTTDDSLRIQFKRLTAAEAQRALYIDFEGGRGKPPVLLGILRRGRKGTEPSVFQAVLDPVFEAAGPASRAFRKAVETAVQRAERGDRRIVSWSQYDLKVVRSLADEDPDLVARFERRYVNALAVAKSWAWQLHRADKPTDGKLSAYLELVGYEVPAGAGSGHVGKTIRDLRPTLEKGRPLTALQAGKWARLLEHNRHDCAGMRKICIRASREIEAAAATRPVRRGKRARRRRRDSVGGTAIGHHRLDGTRLD